MPKRKSLKSLRECCLKRVALSFDSYFLKDFELNFKEIPRLLNVLGPLEDLTNETVQGIIDSLVTHKRLRRQHFLYLLQASVRQLDLRKAGAANGDSVVHTVIDRCTNAPSGAFSDANMLYFTLQLRRAHFLYLLQASVRQLDLRKAGAANGDSVVHTVIDRCTNLTTLNLHGLDSVSAVCLSELVGRVTTLTTLNLKQTNCNDQVLSVLAHHNASLTDLDVSSTLVSDSGALSLCQAWDKAGNLGCRGLVRLDIYGTLIRVKGALHLLQNLPKLQYLGFDDVCSLVETDIKQQGDGVVTQHSLELRYLTSHQVSVPEVTDTSISTSCAVCRNAVEVRLYCGLNDENVASIKELTKLRNLQLGNSKGHSSLTFDRGVLPVLVEIGNQLTDLTLADINDYDLFSVGQTCRNLRSLFLVISGQNDNMPASRPLVTMEEKQHTLFRTLHEFRIVCPYKGFQFQLSAFKVLLRNAKDLKTLHIHYMSCLTSELLLDVLKTNPMLSLEALKLVTCDNIGPKFLEFLVEGDNQLSSLELLNCKNITLRDCETYQMYAKREGFDLEISWNCQACSSLWQ